MFLRIDKLQIELPLPKEPEPNAAAALQELLGGKYGEMSTLGNYLFQSFNFRSKSKLKPFYSLVAITAEELGHVELVSNGVALLNNGPGAPDEVEPDISNAPFADMKDIRLAASFLSNGGGAMPMNSNGASWNMDFVTTTGNVIIDLLHNFHLECGARLHKLRVYETLTDPTGREVCGYLLVRGGVHAHAYALALEKITGVDIKKMLPTPNINLDRIPESQKIWRKALTVGSTASVRTITRKWPASGRGRRRFQAIRRARLRSWTGLQQVERFQNSKEPRRHSHRTMRRKRCSRLPPSYTRNRAEPKLPPMRRASTERLGRASSAQAERRSGTSIGRGRPRCADTAKDTLALHE
jgi:Mn-containing catalase